MNLKFKESSGKTTKTLSVTSGKGGVGKTTFSVNLAFHFSKIGKKVLLLDGDIGLANIDIFLGIRPQKTLKNFFEGQVGIQDILMKVNKHIDVLPGSSGLLDLSSIDIYKRKMLLDEVSSLDGVYDYLIIDTASGLDGNVQYLNSSVQDVIILVTPEPASMADAYALIKVLNTHQKVDRFSVVTNKVISEREGEQLFTRLNGVCQRFLNVGLSYYGSVPLDPRLSKVGKNQLISQTRPTAASSIALERVAKEISTTQDGVEVQGGLKFFWNQFVLAA